LGRPDHERHHGAAGLQRPVARRGPTSTGCDGQRPAHITTLRAALLDEPRDSAAPQVGPIKNRPARGRVTVDNDCNCCTPLQDSSACLARRSWFNAHRAPPPPANTEEQIPTCGRDLKDRRWIEWDNAPELVVDPIQQKILHRVPRLAVEGGADPSADRSRPEDSARWRT
jgi:hypothetical protein